MHILTPTISTNKYYEKVCFKTHLRKKKKKDFCPKEDSQEHCGHCMVLQDTSLPVYTAHSYCPLLLPIHLPGVVSASPGKYAEEGIEPVPAPDGPSAALKGPRQASDKSPAPPRPHTGTDLSQQASQL